jgi:ParB family chromosome partitioning protein
MNKNRVLGKGLSALLNGADIKGVPGRDHTAADKTGVTRLPLEAIGFNPHQPRKTFDDNKLSELADSIKQVGILQPVLVRRLSLGEKAQQHPESQVPVGTVTHCVVAGERRVRASRLAGLQVVPVLLCTYEETEALKVALLENIQREDLGPVEEGEAYRSLMDAYGATQEELATMLGKSRSGVANMLRLLTLDKDILQLLQEGRISRGHAKALLGLPAGPGRLQLAKLCASRGLSVRDCEKRVQAGGARPVRRARSVSAGKGAAALDPTVKALQERAEQVYGSPVAIVREPKTGKGTVELRFYSDDDLIRLLKIMGVDTEL